MKIRNLTLELSFKPFRDPSEAGVAEVAETLFGQWRRLIESADTVAVLFWASDGSEILEYRGCLDDRFEWARYMGVANPHHSPSGLPPELQSVHENPRLYCENPPEFTYRDFKNIVATMRRVFAARYDKPFRVGTTFDPGPEFAKSDFKYRRHNEICRGFMLGGKTFVCCYADLKGDRHPYAGFPDGIPDGTSFGTFLGRQTQLFTRDLGIDYLWLSNGFGFGMETWGACGAVFDGKRFDAAGCAAIKDKMFGFWHDFRRECPDLPVENRGTNLSTGMDLSSDAVPLREIYREVPGIEAPPNSPWAALNGDFGLELVGWLSHIAELPAGKGYPFRFYTHDPWFVNSPWLDRYARSPHDIYLPLSLTRLDRDGRATSPDALKFLTADDSYGRMPDQVPREVVPEIISAWDTAPDRSGPLVWVYPFDEYHDLTYSGERVDEVFFGDWFMRTAVSSGFPLNTVISSGHFAAAADTLAGQVLVVPTAVAARPDAFAALRRRLENGDRVLFYGPASAYPALQELLGLKSAASLEGEGEIVPAAGDAVPVAHFRHLSLYSGGGLDQVAEAPAATAAFYRIGGQERAAMTVTARPEWRGGRAVWVRGTNSFSFQENGNRPDFFDPAQYFYPEELMIGALREFGYTVAADKRHPSQPSPVQTWRYHRNALYFAAHSPDITVSQRLGCPAGAPVFSGLETVVDGGLALYHGVKAANRECRVFVTQSGEAVIGCKEGTPVMPGVRRRLLLSGLRDAKVVFRPETGCEEQTRMLLNPVYPFTCGEFLTPTAGSDGGGTLMTLEHVTGPLMIYW